jgi:hypothetical protein
VSVERVIKRDMARVNFFRDQFFFWKNEIKKMNLKGELVRVIGL